MASLFKEAGIDEQFSCTDSHSY